ncbi:MAG: Gfo/Idh/MocA family oxidoreductase [Planctomycetota bacterium]
MNSPLRIGFVGCGGIAGAHIGGYQANAGVELAAACDISEKAARSVAERIGGRAYTDFEEMLDKEKLDAVSLLTPPAVRLPMTQIICEHKVHIFCEKPLADSVAVARNMAKAAEENDVLLMVAQCHKFHEPVRRTRALIEDGTLGKIRMIRNRFGYSWTKTDDQVRGRGGVLLDNGAHSSYLVRFLGGEPVGVMARGDRADDITLLRDVAAVLETDDGCISIIELNGTVPKSKGVIEVYGTGGMAVIDYAGESAFFPGGSNEKVVLTDPGLPGSHRFDREIGHFLACIRGDETPVIGAEEGIRDLMVIEAIFKSIQQGVRVEVG